MKVKCPACGAVGTDVEPIAPEHRGPHWKPLKGEDDYAFAVYGHEGGRVVRKCLNCGGGVHVKLLPPRYEAIPSERWQTMQRYFEQEMAASEERTRRVFAELEGDQEEPQPVISQRAPTGGLMEFEHSAHEDAYRQTQDWLRQAYGESAVAVEDNPVFSLPTGVMIAVQAFGDDRACIDLWTWPLGSRKTFPDAAYREMLTLNALYRIGNLNVQDGGLLFEYIVDFDGLTKEALSLLVSLLASSSDEIGVTLTEKFGAE